MDEITSFPSAEGFDTMIWRACADMKQYIYSTNKLGIETDYGLISDYLIKSYKKANDIKIEPPENLKNDLIPKISEFIDDRSFLRPDPIKIQLEWDYLKDILDDYDLLYIELMGNYDEIESKSIASIIFKSQEILYKIQKKQYIGCITQKGFNKSTVINYVFASFYFENLEKIDKIPKITKDSIKYIIEKITEIINQNTQNPIILS